MGALVAMSNERPRTPGTDVRFERWWDRNDMDSDPDSHFTWGEMLWKAARKELLREQRKRRKAKNA